MSLLINSRFPCYEADGSVRRGMQTNYCPEGSEEQEEKSQKEREEGGEGETEGTKGETANTGQAQGETNTQKCQQNIF